MSTEQYHLEFLGNIEYLKRLGWVVNSEYSYYNDVTTFYVELHRNEQIFGLWKGMSLKEIKEFNIQ